MDQPTQRPEKSTILWLDNDPGYIYGFVMALKGNGFAVEVAKSVAEADKLLRTRNFDVVLIDVMIPVTEAERNDGYDAHATDEGHKTGLEFYRRHRAIIERQGVAIAMTVRVDRAIRDEFIASGLPAANFLTKLDVRNANDFVSAIKKRLRRAT
ncbi:MAG: response regulator [Acidobacteria bacterium]|nr:response regulator [Acidobacteriota bacterium]MBV9186897.1 response regulator [Acidobacteriota bacterium]